MILNQPYRWVVIMAALLMPHLIWAQLPHEVFTTGTNKIYFRKLTREDGLPSNVTRFAASDYIGYIWIATDNGLVRYDGSEMKVYKYTPGDSLSMVESSVTTIYQASDSMLWVGTKNGLSLFNPASGSFSNYQHNSVDPKSFPCEWILNFYEDGEEIMWIGSNTGLIRTDMQEMTFQHIHLHRNEIPFHRENLFRWVNNIAQNPMDSSTLILATRGGILVLDKTTLKIIHDYDSKPKHLYRCSALYIDKNHQLWTGEWNTGLKKLDLETGRWEKFNPPGQSNLNILSIIPKNDHELWLGTIGKGIGIFNKQDHTFTFILKDAKNPKSLISNWIHGNLFFDGNELWALSSEGISVSDPRYRSFIKYEPPVRMNHLSCMLRDTTEKKLFIGGTNCEGLYYWDEQKHTWNTILPDHILSETRLDIYQLFRDARGTLWINSTKGLLYYDQQKELIRPYRDATNKPLPFQDTVQFALMEDSRGNLWIGTRLDGIACIDSSRKKVTHYDTLVFDDGSRQISHDFKAIKEDRFGRIWFGYYDGIAIFDPETGMFSKSIQDTLEKMGIRVNVVWGIETDKKGRIYLSLDDEGLLRIEEGAKGKYDFRLFHLDHGLNDLNLFAMERDTTGNIWIINEGVTCFDPETETFSVYDARNGLHENKNWQHWLYADDEGNLFLGNGTGYETREINHLIMKPEIRNLLIEQVEINGEIINKGLAARNTGELSLKPYENNLVISYKAICFKDVDQIKYRYTLEGFDEGWQYVGQETKARMTSLPAGKYLFRLQASHRGVWLPVEKQITIDIKPYFWNTTWFFASAIVFIILLFYTFYSYRIHQVRKKERIDAEFRKKLAETEMQALRAQMNPHFIFNSLNSINNFILKNETESASDFLIKFSRLIRQVLNNSKEKMVSLTDDLLALRLYIELEQLRFQHSFDFKLDIDQQLDIDSILVPPLLIQPYVENAIWHGLMHKEVGGLLSITVQAEANQVSFIIEDDGIGRKQAKKYKSEFGSKKQSMGMRITKERIDLLNRMYNIKTHFEVEDLHHPDGTAAGTRVILKIPFITRNTSDI